MKARDAILGIQASLLIPEAQRAPRIGPLTRGRLEALAKCDPDGDWSPMVAEVSKPLPVAPPAERNISHKGIELVRAFEGCELTAYQDEAGVWTIGMGHTGLQHKDGTVYAGRTITMEEAERLFDYDMNQFEHRVTALVKAPLNQDQFDALVSFDFNTGGLTLSGGNSSTLLKALNAGELDRVNSEFMVWNKVHGKAVSGLTRRRLSERSLFNSEDPYIWDMDRFREWQKSKNLA